MVGSEGTLGIITAASLKLVTPPHAFATAMAKVRDVEAARDADVAFLVVGDPFGATTHVDLQLRARRMGVRVEVIHNASIMNAVGACGLQLYRFGEAISIVFFTETWRPDSFYDKILANRRAGLHTLCLLDIRVKELTVKALCTGRKEYEPPRYMSVNVALEQLLEVEAARERDALAARLRGGHHRNPLHKLMQSCHSFPHRAAFSGRPARA